MRQEKAEQNISNEPQEFFWIKIHFSNGGLTEPHFEAMSPKFYCATIPK
jgi:hypothetical protein